MTLRRHSWARRAVSTPPSRHRLCPSSPFPELTRRHRRPLKVPPTSVERSRRLGPRTRKTRRRLPLGATGTGMRPTIATTRTCRYKRGSTFLATGPVRRARIGSNGTRTSTGGPHWYGQTLTGGGVRPLRPITARTFASPPNLPELGTDGHTLLHSGCAGEATWRPTSAPRPACVTQEEKNGHYADGGGRCGPDPVF